MLWFGGLLISILWGGGVFSVVSNLPSFIFRCAWADECCIRWLENLPHAGWLQGLGWPKAAVRTDSFCFSLRPSVVSSFPNDLFGIYQQLSRPEFIRQLPEVQLHAQIYIYVYISDNGCCDSMSCFSMITSKEKVVIATTLFGYMCMRVILKMLGVTKVDTVVGQDGCLCKQRAQQWSEVGWCMFNNWLSLQKLPGFWKFLEGALTKCWLIVHVDFRSVNTPTTVNFKPPIWCQGTCRIPANLTICSCKSEHKPVYRSLKQVHASLILSLHTRVHTHSPPHTHSYTCIQEILFSLQKNVKSKMTYKNKSAGNKVSEMSPDEPSGLSRGKLQFDYFLLLHCSEATTQASFSKCISHQMFFFFNTLHLRGENNFVPRTPAKQAPKSPI